MNVGFVLLGERERESLCLWGVLSKLITYYSFFFFWGLLNPPRTLLKRAHRRVTQSHAPYRRNLIFHRTREQERGIYALC